MVVWGELGGPSCLPGLVDGASRGRQVWEAAHGLSQLGLCRQVRTA